MPSKHTVSKFNPYEPSIRERLAQRDAALRTQAYAATGKSKYRVYKPRDYAAKRELNYFYGSGMPTTTSQHQHYGKSLNYIILDELIWSTIDFKYSEKKWLTERQATMWRLKGYVVELS